MTAEQGFLKAQTRWVEKQRLLERSIAQGFRLVPQIREKVLPEAHCPGESVGGGQDLPRR